MTKQIKLGRLDTIEALRGIAALLVVLYHLQDVFAAKAGVIPFKGLFGSGDRGVDLFFVLSGFVIMTIHGQDIGSPEQLTPYLYKRCCRVFPAVWIMTLLAALVYASHAGSIGKLEKLAPWNIVASVLLLPQTGPALVNVTWTLKYEIFFYAIFAMLIVNRRAGLAVLLAWQGAVLLMAIGLLHPTGFLPGYYLRPICLEFGIGMICAWLMTRQNAAAQVAWASSCLLAAGIGGFASGLLYEALRLPHGLEDLRILVFGGSSGAIILGLTRLERAGHLRPPIILTRMGSVSYAVYLVHYSVITLAAMALLRIGWRPSNDAAPLGCAILGISAGAGFHYLIDLPIQQRLRRLGRHLFGSRPASADGAFMELLAMPQTARAKW